MALRRAVEGARPRCRAAPASACKAAAVLTGSVRRSGNRLRVTAQLIDTASGVYLWSETYDRALRDVFAIQDEISRAIVGTLQIRLAGDVRARAPGAQPGGLEPLPPRALPLQPAHRRRAAQEPGVLPGGAGTRTLARRGLGRAADTLTIQAEYGLAHPGRGHAQGRGGRAPRAGARPAARRGLRLARASSAPFTIGNGPRRRTTTAGRSSSTPATPPRTTGSRSISWPCSGATRRRARRSSWRTSSTRSPPSSSNARATSRCSSGNTSAPSRLTARCWNSTPRSSRLSLRWGAPTRNWGATRRRWECCRRPACWRETCPAF